jgi:hypothetical protein
MSTERSIKAWQQEERVAALSARLADHDGDSTAVMEDLKADSPAG